MTVYLDPPAWPAHGRLWSHLVSDTSLLELRELARRVDVPDRAFDLDHYDVPAERHADLVAAGAVPVDGGTLARRLARSYLRVPGHERRRAKRPELLARWATLWAPSTPEQRRAVDEVGAELVDRWREPHRVYHSRLHLADALDRLDDLLGDGAPGSGRHAAVALWFHDAVHDGAPGTDEERSAALARELLVPLLGIPARPGGAPTTPDDAAEVARLVLVTVDHDPDPDDTTGALVSDADLAVLGGPPARYRRYAAQVRAEYALVGEADFRTGRAAVLDQLLALHTGPGLFRTTSGRARWAARTGTNLRAELASLRAVRQHPDP
ncbi:DUF4031 domain-containing protein [Isoptericola jiangsuensis]|uniref:DUF4031 domain-containing protein n=1 Tax=Isoptericola jiangsuensis TaxID=548579 RepID=UPI003AB08C2D